MEIEIDRWTKNKSMLLFPICAAICSHVYTVAVHTVVLWHHYVVMGSVSSWSWSCFAVSLEPGQLVLAVFIAYLAAYWYLRFVLLCCSAGCAVFVLESVCLHSISPGLAVDPTLAVYGGALFYGICLKCYCHQCVVIFNSKVSMIIIIITTM